MGSLIAAIPAGTWLWPLAGCSFVCGVVLLFWGGKLHRPLLVLIGAASGALVGRAAGQWLGVAPTLATVSGAVTLALFGLVGARLIWAVLGSAMVLGTVSWFLVLSRFANEIPADQSPEQWLAWLGDIGSHLLTSPEDVGKDRQLALAMGVSVISALAVLLVGLWRPRLASILMTSLLGAAGLILAVLIAAEQIRPGLWSAAARNGHVLAGIGTILMLAGLLVQYRRLVLAQRASSDEEDQDDQDDSPSRSRKKSRPNRGASGKGGRKRRDGE